MFYWGLLIGAWIGAVIGFFVAALCHAAARGDELMEAMARESKEREK